MNSYVKKCSFALYREEPLPILQEGWQYGLAAHIQGSWGQLGKKRRADLDMVIQGRLQDK